MSAIMYEQAEPKELKKIFKAMQEINDIAKNINPETKEYVIFNGMLIFFPGDEVIIPRKFYGHTLGIISNSLLSDMGALAHIPMYINGDVFGSSLTTNKLTNFTGIEYTKGIITFVWEVDLDYTDDVLCDLFIDSIKHDHPGITMTDISSDIMLLRQFKEFKLSASTMPKRVRKDFSININTDKIIKAIKYMNSYDRFIHEKQDNIVNTDSISLDVETVSIIVNSTSPMVLTFNDGESIRMMKVLFRGYKSSLDSCIVKHVLYDDGLSQNIIIMNYKRITIASSYSCIRIESKI